MDNLGPLPLLVAAVTLAALWKIFVKAGRHGWAALIPVYNLYVLLDIAGKPGWWLILCFIPLVNLVILFLVNLELAKRFGKGAGFAVGMLLLGFVFLPILAFSDAVYKMEPEGEAPQPSQ